MNSRDAHWLLCAELVHLARGLRHDRSGHTSVRQHLGCSGGTPLATAAGAVPAVRPDPPGARQDCRRAAVHDVLFPSAAASAVRGLRPGRPGSGPAPGRQRRLPLVLPGAGTPVRPLRPARGHLCAPAGGPGLPQLLRPAAAAVRRMRPGPPRPAAGRRRPAGPLRTLRRRASAFGRFSEARVIRVRS